MIDVAFDVDANVGQLELGIGRYVRNRFPHYGMYGGVMDADG